MSDLLNIQSQIEKLQKQASDIKSREFDKTVKEIRTKMQAFGITVKDLKLGTAPKGKAKSGTGKKRGASGASKTDARHQVAAKYRGPAGQTWTGRGLTPRWLSDLLSQGRTKEEFAIAQQ